ncbi:type VI secretion system-associated protein TagF [Pseudorhodoferax sp.]|uniref:type VI secretion system-associated protein TagF n=1 Tax=Pseudorhodoferax sp. TaxID=1993553 RepID=UPI0039E706C4
MPGGAVAAGPPGWFGKLAMLGDFAHRRLPEPVLRQLDRWLSATMQALPQALGERWPQAYLEAPLLRFAWAPGVVDAQWWFGVLMPSCDKVGRYFPLVVLQAGEGEGAAMPEDWYAALERAALGTLERGASLAAFEATVAAAPPWPGACLAPQERQEGRTRWWSARMADPCDVGGLPDVHQAVRLLLKF